MFFEPISRLYPACQHWTVAASKQPIGEYLGDMLRVRTLVPGRSTAAAIFRFFQMELPEDPGERVSQFRYLRQQIFQDLLDLTGDEYRLDWSREDEAFCLWYRHRNTYRDAMRDLSFVRAHTLALFPQAEIRDSHIHGFGLFTLRHWAAGSALGEPLQGQLVTVDQYDLLRVSMGAHVGRLRQFFFMEWNALSDNWLLVRPLRTQYSYVNHSCQPNIALEPTPQGKLQLRVLRDLSPETELTLDYRLEPLPLGYFETQSSGYLKDMDLPDLALAQV